MHAPTTPAAPHSFALPCVHVHGTLSAIAVAVLGALACTAPAGEVVIAITAAVLVMVPAAQPPAGTTTLIVSLKVLATPSQLAVMAGVDSLTVVGWLLNPLRGAPMPVYATES